MRHAYGVINVTGLELALIPAGAALVGVALGIAGNAYVDQRRDRREVTRQRDQAIAELLTATIDLVTGVQAVRAAYQQQGAWRHYVRMGATVLAAVGSAMTGREELTWDMLADWSNLAPGLNRLLAADRELDDKQRTIALDLATVVAPRTVRFYAAVAVLTLGSDKKIADAVRELTPAVGSLLEVIAAKEKKYAQARAHADKALAKFRTIADQRRR
jgi:hypothetical protein